MVVLYVLGYTGMIIHDLFIKKDPMEFMPKPKDVDIDISDEAGQFKPITVEKSEPRQQTAAAQSHSAPKSDEEIVTARPIADGKSKENDEEAQSAPPPPSATQFGSDNVKSEGKTSEDFCPRPTDAETQKRINELVKLRRGEMLTDEMTASKEDSLSALENTKEEEAKNSDPDVRIIGPEHTVSPDVPDAVGKDPSRNKVPSVSNHKETVPRTPSLSKKSGPPKPPKQQEFLSNPYFDMKVAIDRVKQHTKLQGGQTAEQISEQAKCAFIDEAFMVIKQIDSDWEKIEYSRGIDEDDQLAIDKAAKESREAPPQFNI